MRVLLPLAFLLALVYASQGVIQNLHGTTVAHTLEHAVQVIPGGPIASQEAIKELGTNGGGFLNANSAHPFENPNGFTNLLQIASLLLIPFALTYAFGRMVKDQKQGWVLFAAMFVLWIAVAALAMGAEVARQPAAHQPGRQPGRHRPPRAAATWRARRSASGRPRAVSTPARPPAPPTAPSSASTTASPPWAAWPR